MSDPIDREISQAIKAASDRSLAGWTFTPEMRKAVLDQIAAEPAQPAAQTPLRPRRNLVRPLSWFAAAAAVLLVSFNLVPKMMNNNNPSADMAALKSGTTASAPESPADRQRSAAAENASAEATALALSAEPAEPDSSSDEPISALAAPAPAPGGGTPEDHGEVQMMVAQAGPRGSRIALVAPPADAGDEVGEAPANGTPITLMAAPTNLSVSSLPEGDYVVLTGTAVRVFDQEGALVTENALTNSPGLLATAPDGRIAVADGARVQTYGSNGQPAGSLELDAPPHAIALGPGERLAVAGESGTDLFTGSRFVARIDSVQAAALAFAGDGVLALLAQDGAGRSLRLYADDGTLLAAQPVPGDGQGLAFTADGQQIVAGSQVFDRSGQLLWEVPFPPVQAAAFGSGDALLVWSHQVVSLFHAQDGSAIWSADYPDGTILQAAGSAAGDRVAVVGESEIGASVWVLDETGAQRYAERLDRAPVGLAIAENNLILLTSSGVDVRTLDP